MKRDAVANGTMTQVSGILRSKAKHFSKNQMVFIIIVVVVVFHSVVVRDVLAALV